MFFWLWLFAAQSKWLLFIFIHFHYEPVFRTWRPELFQKSATLEFVLPTIEALGHQVRQLQVYNIKYQENCFISFYIFGYFITIK